MAEKVKPASSSKDKGVSPPVDEKPYAPSLTGHPALKILNTIKKLKTPGPDSN
jgi:hypothetical protein